MADLPGDYAFAGPPVVFQLFGRMNAAGDFAFTEEKLVEFSHRFQSRDLRPQNLFDVLRTRAVRASGA